MPTVKCVILNNTYTCRQLYTHYLLFLTEYLRFKNHWANSFNLLYYHFSKYKEYIYDNYIVFNELVVGTTESGRLLSLSTDIGSKEFSSHKAVNGILTARVG